MEKTSARTYAGYFHTRACLYKLFGDVDTTAAKALIDRLGKVASQESDPRLSLYARDAYIEYVLKRRRPLPLDSILIQREALVSAAVNLSDPAYVAWSEQNLANTLYLHARQYDRAFEIHLRVYRSLRHFSDAGIPDRRNFLGSIGHHYYEFAEYRQAIHFLAEAVEGSPPREASTYDWRQAYNTLGLCHRELGQYDSSDYYFGEALRISTHEHNKNWIAISRGNLGINLYRRGAFSEAIPLLAEDLDVSVERRDWNNATGALLPLADIALRQNRTIDATRLLDTARRYIARSATTAARLPLYYSIRAREAAALGQVDLASVYIDSLAAAKDSLARQYSALHLVRAEQRLAATEMRASLATAAARQRLVVLQRNTLIIILTLAAGLSILGLKYYRQRRKEIAEKSAAALRLKEAELETAESALARFRQDVREKSAIIEQLSAQLDEGEHSAILQQLRDATILTDAQWAEFRRLFEQVHGGFIARLARQYPGLSPAETRFLVLARLGYSTKEMATALGISPTSVRVTWHRLRRKLELDEEIQAGALVERI